MAGTALRTLAFGALALALAANAASSEEPPEPVYLRSTGDISPRADRFIAENARPVELSPQVRASIGDLTPAEIIEAVCGSVRDGHYDVFVSRNEGLARNEPIGERASGERRIEVPACLYIGTTSSEELRAALGGAAPQVETLRGEQTQQGFNPFRRLMNPLGSLRDTARYIQLRTSGQQTVTLIGVFEPVGVKRDDFIQGVQRAAEGRVVLEADTVEDDGEVAREPGPGEGQITLGIDQGEVAAAGLTCEGGAPAYTPQAALAFYGLARQRGAERGVGGGPVDIVVVDNGFYGATRGVPWEAAWADSQFPSHLFRNVDGTVASSLRADGGHPLNNGQPNTKSGHGTHVTGLALGGPDLLPMSQQIFNPDGTSESWLRVTIYNVSDGSNRIDVQTQRDLAIALRLIRPEDRPRRIVNMSITFFGQTELAPVFELMTGDDDAAEQRDLFIVAAGNTLASTVNHDVGANAIYPAALGGIYSRNVLSVAAHDANYQLAAFSNYSGSRVDMAAPGCALRSWISRNTIEPLSGTSMATPLVTHAAALVASLVENMTSEEIKRRIVVSGDLLQGQAAEDIAFRVRLNTLRALLLFDDVIELTNAPGVFIGGDLEPGVMSGVRCEGDRYETQLRDMWSFKRGASGAYLYEGLRTRALTAGPCPAEVADTAEISFRERFRITQSGEVQTSASGEYQPIPMSQISSIVQRHPPRLGR